MLRNLFISSIRIFTKNLTSSLINFLGLTVSFGCVLVIGLYLHHELTFDHHHTKVNRIYRLTHNEKAGEIPGDRHLATVGPPVGPFIKQSFSGVEDVVRFRYSPNHIIQYGEAQHYENRVYYADPSVFNIFSFPFKSGNPDKALDLPNSVVLTSTMARKYFGDEDPIGKTLLLDNQLNLIVTGVLEPIPSNTHLKFDFLLPFEAFEVPHGYPVDLNTWGWISFYTYVLLQEGQTVNTIEKQLAELVKDHWPEDRARKFKIQMQPLSNIHLGEVKDDQVITENKTYLQVLSIVGVLILFIAGFNFANLYTAICVTRVKEIGVRKTTGATKRYISVYIISEAVLLSVIAFLIASIIVGTALPLFPIEGVNLQLNFLSPIWLVILLFALLTGCLASLYPATLLAGYDQQKLLKGVFRTSPKGLVIRKALVLIQFSITIALISSVFIIDDQITYMNTKDLGYDKNELILLRMPGEQMNKRFQTLKSKLLQHSQIESVALGGGRMDGDTGSVPIYVDGNLEEGTPMAIDAVAFDFFETIGVRMLAGREITEQQPADTITGVMINESASKVFGWTPEQALGRKIKVGEIVLNGEVIGVIPDFHFGLLRDEIQPLIVNYPRIYLKDIYVRFKSGTDLNELVNVLRSEWNQIAPEFPFDYVFLNEYLHSQYASEKVFSVLFKLFAGVAILISIFGLFGLVSQDISFRLKELGVRKILGANSMDLMTLTIKPFIILIILSNAIAWPLSWLGMSTWLMEFNYHTNISLAIFLWTGVATLCIALSTLIYKVWKAAKTNPIKVLKNE